MKAQKLNRRQARWALYLSRFDFTLKHVPENSIEKANSLSRHLDQQIGVKRNNEDRMLVKKEWLEVRAIQVIKIIIKEINLLEKIKKSKVKDNKVIKVVEEMKQAGVKMLKDKEQQKENGLILRNRKVYIPRDKRLRAEII